MFLMVDAYDVYRYFKRCHPRSFLLGGKLFIWNETGRL